MNNSQQTADLHKNHRDEQYLARRNVRDLPEDIRRMQKRLAGLEADLATVDANAPNPPSMEALGGRLDTLPEKVTETRRRKLGTCRGLEYGVIQHPMGQMDAYLDGVVPRRTTFLRDNPGPHAVLNAIERLADGYEGEIAAIRAEIGVRDGQLRDYEARLGSTFAHEEYQRELADLRDRLKLGLSEKPPEGGESVAELAEKIKALRAANTVEAAPVRLGTRKTSRAERPVTARIRERMADVATRVVQEPEPMVEVIPMPEPVKIEGVEPIKPFESNRDYRQRVAAGRRQVAEQLRLF